DHLDLYSFPTRRSSDLYAEPVFIGIVSFYCAISFFVVFRNFRRQARIDADLINLKKSIKAIQSESILSAVGFSCITAIPLAFGRSEEHTSELQSRENLV